LFATLFTFVIATALFNGTVSFNPKQIERRAALTGAVNGDYESLQKEISRLEALKARPAPAELTDAERVLMTTKTALVDGTGELGYLKRLMPQSKSEEDKLKALRQAAAFDLQLHVARQTAFDTVQIPLIGLGVTSSDIGIVGGLGLIVIGYWLLAALRGEAHAFGEFIRFGDSGYSTDHSPYTREESAYAFGAIRHYMIFSVSTKDSLINAITIFGFLIPPVLVLYNHWATANTLLFQGRMELGRYFQPHVISEALVALGVVLVWSRALKYQLLTVRALQAWRQLVESYSIRPALRRIRIR